ASRGPAGAPRAVAPGSMAGVAAGDFGLRHSRWRAWLRARTPAVLYVRLGLVVPKARDCGAHEWFDSADELDACYHCEATQPHAGPPRAEPAALPPARSSDSDGVAHAAEPTVDAEEHHRPA
ncbi:MAG: hypothetical protein ACHQZR_05460, partial [Candidatus Limnocylindrales bacterium]